MTNMQKIFFDILVQTALTVGLFWTILKITPKSALLSFTILQSRYIHDTVGETIEGRKLFKGGNIHRNTVCPKYKYVLY